MTASTNLTLRAAVALIAVLGMGVVHAAEPEPAPPSMVHETPAFQAPEDPPPDDAVVEPLEPEPAAPLALQDALALALMRNPELATFSWEVRLPSSHFPDAGRDSYLQTKRWDATAHRPTAFSRSRSPPAVGWFRGSMPEHHLQWRMDPCTGVCYAALK